jgi:hypothetical protein
MKQRSGYAIAVVLMMIAVAACGSRGSSASTSSASQAPAASIPIAASFPEYEAALCAAFTSLIRSVGNPDAGTPSVLSKSLDDAVAAGDVAAAGRIGGAITMELESGRHQASLASGWGPGKPSAIAIDHVLVAFEVMTVAKVANANKAAAPVDPQSAFEKAGGREAWSALLTSVGTVPVPAGASPQPCRAFSGTL